MFTYNVAALVGTRVIIGDATHTVGEYPLAHVHDLLGEYGAEVAEVIARLECDGWTPLDIVQGAAR